MWSCPLTSEMSPRAVMLLTVILLCDFLLMFFAEISSRKAIFIDLCLVRILWINDVERNIFKKAAQQNTTGAFIIRDLKLVRDIEISFGRNSHRK